MSSKTDEAEKKSHERDLRGLRVKQEEVVDTIVRLLPQSMNLETVELLDSRITAYIEHRQRMMEASSAFRAYEMPDIDQAFADKVEDDLLPKVADYVYDAVPVPGERGVIKTSGATNGVLFALLDIFQRIRRQARHICGVKIGQTEQKRLAGRLSGLAAFYHKQLKEQLSQGENPDISGISSDQFRLDVLRWVLEDLGEETAIKAVRTQANATARLAVRSAEDIVSNYFLKQDLDSQFEFSAVLANVDDLITLIKRVIEAEEQDRKDEPTIVQTLGSSLVATFIDDLGKTILAVFRDIDRKLELGSLTQNYLESNLTKAIRIYEFCHFVDHQYGQQVFRAVQRAITKKSREIFETLMRLESTAASQDDLARYQGYKRAVSDFLVTLADD